MDLDGDGFRDVISASNSGELYLFAGRPKGKFAAAEQITGDDGEVMNVDGAYMLSATDWD
ncbi:MAG: FG-GAP-like repeat-containing protein, partial [Planctomycetota bacterium]